MEWLENNEITLPGGVPFAYSCQLRLRKGLHLRLRGEDVRLLGDVNALNGVQGQSSVGSAGCGCMAKQNCLIGGDVLNHVREEVSVWRCL